MNLQGIILRGIGGFYYIKTDEGVFECKAKGIFRKEKITPVVGDRCEIVVLDYKESLGNLSKILPRKNQLIRPPVANIDTLVVVCTACSPEPDTVFIDKLVAIAENNSIKPVLIINKIDLEEGQKMAEHLACIYNKAGYVVIMASASNGFGMDEIRGMLQGDVVAFAGASGVGKSSLINRLLPDVEMETGGISTRTQRGKHTTRHVELHCVDGFMIMDTPGFSMLEFNGVTVADLESLFVEFNPYIGKCRFRGCRHVNEPDCAVKKAVDTNEIAVSRHESYVGFYNLLKDIKEWDT